MPTPKRLRIALVSRYYPPDPGGGLALYTQQIAREFVNQGHEVSVIAASTSSKRIIQEDAGVKLYRVPQFKVFRRSLTGASCIWNSTRIANQLKQLHYQAPLDIIHCPATFFESLVFGRILKPELGVPLVIKFHENGETYRRVEGRLKQIKAKRRQWFKRFLQHVSLDANYWLGVSGHALDSTLDYLELDKAPIPRAVSPSPLDLSKLKPTPAPPGYLEKYNLRPDTPFLFYSGRLIYEKGLHLLVDAFLSDIAQRFPEVHLAVAGEFDYRQPDYEKQIRRSIAGHPAAGRIHFLGRVPYSEIPYWYSQCSVFVGPSFCEPFGRVFIEAMACEAAFVGFNSGGPREFVHHGRNGFLVEEQTADALAQAIVFLLENPELRMVMGKNGRHTVQACYSQEQVAEELLSLYQELVQHKAVV